MLALCVPTSRAKAPFHTILHEVVTAHVGHATQEMPIKLNDQTDSYLEMVRQAGFHRLHHWIQPLVTGIHKGEQYVDYLKQHMPNHKIGALPADTQETIWREVKERADHVLETESMNFETTVIVAFK